MQVQRAVPHQPVNYADQTRLRAIRRALRITQLRAQAYGTSNNINGINSVSTNISVLLIKSLFVQLDLVLKLHRNIVQLKTLEKKMLNGEQVCEHQAVQRSQELTNFILTPQEAAAIPVPVSSEFFV